MQPVTLGDLVKRAYPYERQPVAFAPSLRRAVWVSVAAILIASVIYPLLLSLASITDSFFFRVLNDFVTSLVMVVQQWLPWLRVLNGVSIGAAGILAVLTRRFTQGSEVLHWLAFAVVVVGGGNALLIFIVGVSVIIALVANLIYWGIVAALVIGALWVAYIFLQDML